MARIRVLRRFPKDWGRLRRFDPANPAHMRLLQEVVHYWAGDWRGMIPVQVAPCRIRFDRGHLYAPSCIRGHTGGPVIRDGMPLVKYHAIPIPAELRPMLWGLL
ncbi:hypothetical protein BLI708_04955 [Bifidobacterium imperatoris]|uniref:Uncharacterized protein n=1 Tax=Bifidobacterium imperatoris TaxID=2020965 RepID=A0A2N5ISP2_9BIFI|nr:hypothetical protein [Bifidobacterium imperatoris]PLS24972.1 hypothetical protein Tam1G_0828 [Bifidobacterium imperatoris]QSY58611.1 hypothetical protein BLI708_04955 [Bifidobacterium imperatoris]